MTANQTHSCPAGEDVAALLRDELDAEHRQAIQAHLKACATCQSLADSLTETISALEAVESEATSRDLAPEILARIHNEDTRATMHPAWSGRLLLRIAAALVLALGIFVSVRQARQTTGHAAQARSQTRKKGLLWLVKAQDTSGKWDPERWGGRKEYTIGLTSMALLSLARDTENLPGKTDCMRRAIDFLLSQQSDNGRFGHDFDGTMYNHGIATVSLLEACSRDKDAPGHSAVKKALGFIRNQQLLSGGWGYHNRAGELANTSISVWPLQALLMSQQAGWQDEGHTLKRGLAWMVGVVDHRGQFSYSQGPATEGPSDALTAMGATCVLQAANSGIAVDHNILSRIRSALAKPAESVEQQTDFYKTYFQVCALDASRAEKWAESMVQLQDDLVDTHEASGPEEGSWTPRDQWSDVGGRIYSTALASLSLNDRARLSP